MNCQSRLQSNCSYENWSVVVTPASPLQPVKKRTTARVGYQCWHVKKCEMRDMQRMSSSHSPTSCFIFNNVTFSGPPTPSTPPALPQLWWKNKGQGSTPHFRLLLWLLTRMSCCLVLTLSGLFSTLSAARDAERFAFQH